MTRRILSYAAVALALVFVGIQFVPTGVDNPADRIEPAWDAPTTRALAARACFDCHSNEVVVPWYGHVAPFSWLVAEHVDDGRRHLNLQQMDREQRHAHEAGEELAEGKMPPTYYTLLHPEARLTDDERDALVNGLNATLGGDDPHEH